MSALDDYFDAGDDNFWGTQSTPTTETTSAGTDWSGVFGDLLKSGASVAGNFFNSTAAKQTAKVNAQANASASMSKTTLYLIIGGIAVVFLGGFLLLRRGK